MRFRRMLLGMRGANILGDHFSHKNLHLATAEFAIARQGNAESRKTSSATSLRSQDGRYTNRPQGAWHPRFLSHPRSREDAKKSLKKRLHKRQSAHYKCAHEHPTPQYFTRGAGRTRLGELAATRCNCPRFLARARHASCARRQSSPFRRCGASGGGERNCASGFSRANRYAIAK